MFSISIWSVLLFALSAVGLPLLIVFIVLLVRPFTGWRHEYPVSETRHMLQIPAPGKYDVCLNRNRFWLLKMGDQMIQNIIPQIQVAITQFGSGAQIPFHSGFGMTSRAVSRVSITVGWFEVTHGGSFIIDNLSMGSMLEDDKLIVRKHIGAGKMVGLIFGIIFSSMAFLGGLIAGIALLVH